MGKGDRKTRRGKLFKGSYGVRRKRKKGITYRSETKIQEKSVKNNMEETVAKPAAKTNAASKKTTRKKKDKDETTSEEAE